MKDTQRPNIPGELELWERIYSKVLSSGQPEKMAAELADMARECYHQLATKGDPLQCRPDPNH
jgi:hypothetical protein